MSVDRLVQKIKLGERGLIQKSMYQLILIMAENPNAQEEIMRCLPEEEILKMMTFLEDPDSTFRKLTAKFFLDLVYGNFAVQQVFCEILGILCCDGKVCLNKVPETSKNGARYFPECIDVLKKVYSEELKETAPYCWFFSDEYNKYQEKQMEFIPESARRGLENIDNFIDPMYAMIGFVVRTSKAKKTGERRTEHREKNNVSKEYDNRRLNTTANIGSGGVSSSTNTSFDYALQPRHLNDSKANYEKDVFKSISPMATAHSNTINPCVYSSRINYPKTTKAKIDNSVVSQSLCSTERFAKLKFEAVSARNESVPYVNSTIRDPNSNPHGYIVEKDRIKLLNNTLDVNRFAATEGDFSLDTLEHLPTSQNFNNKMVASMNDSQEFSVKLLETSVDNSVVNNSRMVNPYGHLEISAEVSPFRGGGSINQSKIENKQERVQTVRNKHLELDKKYIANTFRDKNNAYPVSASTTPKSSLLNKILKEKPLSKEINNASSKSKVKQEHVKRLNVTAAPAPSSSITGSKHVSPKYSTNASKTKVYNKYETDSNNKKYAFHNSLMKSMDVSDMSHHMGLIEERDELSKENYQHHDVSERVQTAKYENRNTKSYQSPAVFKSITTTPRTPVDYFKSTIAQNAKILNARKSHDTSYLFTAMRDTGRRNTEASIPLQTCKNRHADPQSNYGKMCLTEFSPEPSRPRTPKLFYK